MKVINTLHLPSVVAIAAIALPGLAPAQEVGHFGLEEIVVTARKREENLQHTPVAVSAFTDYELKVRNITSTDSLADVTPNLTFESHAPGSGSNSAAQVFIRGIGQTDFTAVTDPGVGLYVDDVYYARSIGGVFDFLDVERIEILRGPQGTLFGRNTIGGAVSIHTRRPSDQFGGSIEAEVGSDAMQNVTFDINVPVLDTLLSKLTLSSRRRDGYVDRVYDGKKLGDHDALSGRLALQWQPTDSLEFFLSADVLKEREQGSPSVSVGLNDMQTFAHVTNIQIPTCVSYGKPPAPPVSTNGDPNCLNYTTFKSKYKSEGTGKVASDLDYWGASLSVSWDVTEKLNIKSITAYRNLDSYSARDGDNTQYRIFETQDPFKHEQWSQEFQFGGNAFEERLSWLVGLYYFQERADNPNPAQFPVPFIGGFVSGGRTDNDNFAIFGQATWDATEDLHFTVGLRYTDETKRFSPYSYIPDGGFYIKGGPGSPAVRFYDCPTGAEPGCGGVPGRLFTAGDRLVPAGWYKRKFSDVTPMFNVAYDVTDEVMVYATWSQGFKSGGFDQRYNADFLGGATSFKPETATTWELGMKSTWLDNMLRLNVAGFFTDYEDQHIIVREGFAPITFNAGESNIKGFETEITFVPTDSWLMQVSVGYIDAGYTQLDPRVLQNSPITKGTKLALTPEWSASAGIAYTREVGGWGTITPRVDWSYRSEIWNDAINTPQIRQKGYHLINASVAFVSTDQKWELILSGRNLNDKEYLAAGLSALGTAGAVSEAVFSRGSEWSLSAKYHF